MIDDYLLNHQINHRPNCSREPRSFKRVPVAEAPEQPPVATETSWLQGANAVTGGRRRSSTRVFSSTTLWAMVSTRSIHDLANQVLFSEACGQALSEAGCQPGGYITCQTGEWFSGLPSGWTSADPGAVNLVLSDGISRKRWQLRTKRPW